MIESVIGSYLDSLEEREFDELFMALLRANGFTDVHFLHGAFEFGKDFIARARKTTSCANSVFRRRPGISALAIGAKRAGKLMKCVRTK
jgi:hypothetical protein